MYTDSRVHSALDTVSRCQRANVTKKNVDRVVILENPEREYFFAFKKAADANKMRELLGASIAREQEAQGITMLDADLVVGDVDTGMDLKAAD
ncbi:hypothetical protein KIPB_014689, partial [Kipferlia bialata]|eukprot:g14689.t1